jgi:hypothetical protein
MIQGKLRTAAVRGYHRSISNQHEQSHIQKLLAVNASRYKHSLGTINTQQFLTTHDVYVFIKHNQ